jgi:hypothetical protein
MARSLPLKGSQDHIINLISCFCKFCTKFDTHALFHAPRLHKYKAWHKHQRLLVVTALDWMAALRSCWLRICRNTWRHVQKSPNTVWCKVLGKWTTVQTHFDQALYNSSRGSCVLTVNPCNYVELTLYISWWLTDFQCARVCVCVRACVVCVRSLSLSLSLSLCDDIHT